MDTKSNIPHKKTVVKVEWPASEDAGFGPQGKHTRKQWRDECLENLEKGSAQFDLWQKGWESQIEKFLPGVSFSTTVYYDDDSKVELFNIHRREFLPYSFDFIGQNLTKFVALSGVNVLQTALFSAATFREGYMDLQVYFFRGNMNFGNTKFKADAFFDYTVFDRTARFNSVVFNGVANFTNAIVNGEAIFSETQFKMKADFSSARFYLGANFYRAHFKKYSFFKETYFSKEVNFENTKFDAVGHFEQSYFKEKIPNFLGVDNSKTLLVFSSDEYFYKEDTTEDAVKHIGQLKRLADEQGQIDQALMFNKFELNAKRAQARIKTKPLNFLQKLVNSDFWFANATASYDIFSSYGRSFTKPLKYYFGLLLVVYILALGNAVVNSPKNCKAENLRMLSDLWRDDTPCDISKTNPDDKTRLNGYRAAAEYTV